MVRVQELLPRKPFGRPRRDTSADTGDFKTLVRRDHVSKAMDKLDWQRFRNFLHKIGSFKDMCEDLWVKTLAPLAPRQVVVLVFKSFLQLFAFQLLATAVVPRIPTFNQI